jgi:hypothetical protein
MTRLKTVRTIAIVASVACGSVLAASLGSNNPREVLFGNLHVHTGWSFDGYSQGATTTPDDAYRWARGEVIEAGAGYKFQIKGRPLDWYAVTDHAEFLGVFQEMANPESALSKLDISKRLTSGDRAEAWSAYAEIFDCLNSNTCAPELTDPELAGSLWGQLIETTNKHNVPGEFTTLVGFEWTSGPDSRNLHRVVVFGDSEYLPELPYTSYDSKRPEDLWQWMDTLRDSGASLLAVPHNGNASDGLMFPEDESFGGSAVNQDYAQARMRNEPLYEITQIKGTSETHPELSPNDEFAGFELWDYRLDTRGKIASQRQGSYARDALLRGMKIEAEGRGNPYKLGFIGDSDTHNAAGAFQEFDYTGKFGINMSPTERLFGSPGLSGRNIEQVRLFSSAGLAAVWARENTREEIFAALARKETYATTGTRMRVRAFASFDYSSEMMESVDWADQAYRDGVPMGGELNASDAGDSKTPVIIVAAMKDPESANLDRIQIIKGWTKNGQTVEKVFDVALSDKRKVGPGGRAPHVGNTVDPTTGNYSNSIGASQLRAFWVDPEFDKEARTFYYARIIEIPTARWSTLDAHALGITPPAELPPTIQERAFTSPIWYTL